MSSTLAPIVFFAYKRPEHTRRSLESLSQNIGAKDSELFIYCDGIKHEKDIESVNLVRQVVRSQQWCGTVHIIEREKNWGLADSVIRGVTEICDRYGKVIVLEDDLILSRYFLDYMNTALDLYQNETKVMQISGYMFPVNLRKCNSDAIFLPFTSSWGWGTWQRAWNYFDPDLSNYKLLTRNKKLRYAFNLNNSYPYFDMLKLQVEKRIDSWAIRWYLSTFMQEALTLYPTQSLVENIGFDGTGTHCNDNLFFSIVMSDRQIKIFPKDVIFNLKSKDDIINYMLLSQEPKTFLKRLFDKFKRLLNNKI